MNVFALYNSLVFSIVNSMNYVLYRVRNELNLMCCKSLLSPNMSFNTYLFFLLEKRDKYRFFMLFCWNIDFCLDVFFIYEYIYFDDKVHCSFFGSRIFITRCLMVVETKVTRQLVILTVDRFQIIGSDFELKILLILIKY